jgi:mycothiol synthase
MGVTVLGHDWGTGQAEAELALRGIRVRRARPEDQPAIRALCQAHGHEGWAVETGTALQKTSITAFVAESVAAGPQDQVRAFAAHSVVGLVHFGPMLTAADLRGQGIGTVLVRRCLQDWQRAGVSRCEIVWAGPLSFWTRGQWGPLLVGPSGHSEGHWQDAG